MPLGPTFTFPLLDPTTVTPPAAGNLGLVANLAGVLCTINSAGAIYPLFYNNILSTQIFGNAGGNTIIGPGNGNLIAVATITGAANVRQFYLSNIGLTNLQAGYRIKVLFLFNGQVAGINLQVYDTNAGGQELFQFTTDSIQKTAVADFYWDGANWQIDQANVPATT